GLDLGERALLEIRERSIDQLADHEAEYGVSQELQPLIVGRAKLPILVREGLVRERPLEQIEVAERVAELLLEGGRRIRRDVIHDRVSGAGGRSRTGTGLVALGILSPVRLPIPPLRRSWTRRLEHRINGGDGRIRTAE